MFRVGWQNTVARQARACCDTRALVRIPVIFCNSRQARAGAPSALRAFSHSALVSEKPQLPVSVIESEDGGEPLVYNRPQKKRRKPWYTSPVMYVLAAMPFVTLYLGFWQMRRLKWKVNLIDELDDKLRREPLRLPRNINMDVLHEFEFRLVEVRGRYDTSRALFVGPRSRDGNKGYNVIMPFRRSAGGQDVLVNRGFVTDDQIEGTGMDKRLKQPLPDGDKEMTIVALMPRVYPPSRFALVNEPHNNLWMQLDPNGMTRWLNEQAGWDMGATDADMPQESKTWSLMRSLTMPDSKKRLPPLEAFQVRQDVPVLPVYLEQVFTGTFSEAGSLMRAGIPVGRTPRIELRNPHAEYAATWFTLSAFTAVMFVYMARKGRATQ